MLQVYERAYRLNVVTHKICQMLQNWDKLLSTNTLTELHRDWGIAVRSSGKWFCPMWKKNAGFASRICWEFKQLELNWNRIVHQSALWRSDLLYNPTMKQTDLRAGCKLALQPGTMTDRRSETFFSLPRIKVQRIFLISQGRLTDRLESTTALSILNGPTSFFVASRSIAEVNDFSKKIKVIQDGCRYDMAES